MIYLKGEALELTPNKCWVFSSVMNLDLKILPKKALRKNIPLPMFYMQGSPGSEKYLSNSLQIKLGVANRALHRAFGKLKPESWEVQTSLGCITRPCLTRLKKN